MAKASNSGAGGLSVRSKVATLDKALALLDGLLRDQARRPLGDIAQELGIAGSSARRMVLALQTQGFLFETRRGRYAAGTRLMELAAHATLRARLIHASQSDLGKLAIRTGAVANLGVLEGDMVTYLVSEAEGRTEVVTRADMQLEAYCTGIGKMLLASLPDSELKSYLDTGPFVSITPQTITRPGQLRAELVASRERGYAIDDAEMFENLFCTAVPVMSGAQCVAAISLARAQGEISSRRRSLDIKLLRQVAQNIAVRLAR